MNSNLIMPIPLPCDKGMVGAYSFGKELMCTVFSKERGYKNPNV